MKELTRWKSVQIKHLCVCDKDYWLKNFIREMRTTFPGFLIHTLLTCRMKTVDCSVQHQKPRTPVQVRSQVFCTQRMISVVKNNKRHMRFQQPTELLHWKCKHPQWCKPGSWKGCASAKWFVRFCSESQKTRVFRSEWMNVTISIGFKANLRNFCDISALCALMRHSTRAATLLSETCFEHKRRKTSTPHNCACVASAFCVGFSFLLFCFSFQTIFSLSSSVESVVVCSWSFLSSLSSFFAAEGKSKITFCDSLTNSKIFLLSFCVWLKFHQKLPSRIWWCQRFKQ